MGDVESYGYDARNRRNATVLHLDRITVPARTVTTGMSYDRAENVVEERLANGNVLTHSYDALDRRTATTDLLGLVSETTYDARGNAVLSRDANGRETVSLFDGLDRVVQLQEPEDRTTSFAFDAAGNQVSETDPRGQTRTFEYDRLNRLVREISPAPFLYQTSLAYDAVGNLLSRTDARGHTTAFEYDALDRQVREISPAPLSHVTTVEYDLVGNVVRQTDRRGIVVEMEYDRENRLLRRRRAGVLLDEHRYDGVGNALRSWDASRNLVERSFDERGLLLEESRPLGAVTTFRYDDAGDRVEEVDPEGRRETLAYDLRQRVLSRTNGAGETTEYAYDGVGNRTLRRRPLGGEWLYGFDGADRLTSVEDPLGNRTEYGYDANGNRTSITDAAGKLTGMAYDELNRLGSMTYADGAVETYTYDAAGNRTSKTDPLGRETVFAYDELNRQTSRSYAAGSELTSITFQYDPAGNLIEAAEAYASAPSAVTTQTWDDFDRLETRTDRYGRTLTYAYDANGNRTRLLGPDGGSTTYTYDALNRLESVTPAGQEPTLYSWLRNGLLQEINYPNGVRSAHTYDLANRIETISNTLGPAPISSLAYAYDGNGNRSEQVDSQSGAAETTTYQYDTADRLVSVSYPESSISYVYDSVGNRLEEQEEDPLGTLLGDRSYLYDDRHRLEAISDLVDPDQSVAYTYDANGNQTSRTVANGESLSFLYDHRDRLEEVQRDGLLLERYAYDYQGLRVRKAGPAGVEETTLDDGEPFWRTDGQGLRTATYHWGPDRLLALDSAQQGLAYYLQDALGSPTHLVSPEGTLEARQQLDAWGNPRGTSSFDSVNNPFSFTGYEEDPATGLLYAKARYYDPKVGRFLTRDPFQGSPQTPPSLHKYLYAHANPTVFVDPTGSRTETVGDDLFAPRPRVLRPGEKVPDGYILQTSSGNVRIAVPSGYKADSADTESESARETSVWERIASFVSEPARRLFNALKGWKNAFERGTGSTPTSAIDEENVRIAQSEKPELRELAEQTGEVVEAAAEVVDRASTIQGATGGGLVLVRMIRSGARRFVKKEALREFLGEGWEVADDRVQLAGQEALQQARVLAAGFDRRSCVECADALVEGLKKRGVQGKRIELRTLSSERASGAYIYHDGIENIITVNGRHQAVEVDGVIFDNINPSVAKTAEFDGFMLRHREREGNATTETWLRGWAGW